MEQRIPTCHICVTLVFPKNLKDLHLASQNYTNPLMLPWDLKNFSIKDSKSFCINFSIREI